MKLTIVKNRKVIDMKQMVYAVSMLNINAKYESLAGESTQRKIRLLSFIVVEDIKTLQGFRIY